MFSKWGNWLYCWTHGAPYEAQVLPSPTSNCYYGFVLSESCRLEFVRICLIPILWFPHCTGAPRLCSKPQVLPGILSFQGKKLIFGVSISCCLSELATFLLCLWTWGLAFAGIKSKYYVKSLWNRNRECLVDLIQRCDFVQCPVGACVQVGNRAEGERKAFCQSAAEGSRLTYWGPYGV